MAVCFELAVNFGTNTEAARRAALTSPSPSLVLTAGRQEVPLHRAVLSSVGPYTQLSVFPVAVGYGVALDGTLPRFRLSAAELTELGHGLYSLLARFDGYIAARVGWEPEDLLDPGELKAEWRQELADGSIDGLVLSGALHDELGLAGNGHWIEFQPGYLWVPYQGEKHSTLTSG